MSPPPLIVSVRGTHGSGKSSAVRAVMARYPQVDVKHAPQSTTGKLKERGYWHQLPDNRTLFVAGPYLTACGGCDAINPYEDIWPLIKTARDFGQSVLFEGALVSSSYGIQVGKASEEYGDGVVFAFLDTPLEVCIARVQQRRAAAGKPPLEDPRNIVSKYASVQKSIATIRDVHKRRVVVIDHTKPVTGIMKLFGVRINKEPIHGS